MLAANNQIDIDELINLVRKQVITKHGNSFLSLDAGDLDNYNKIQDIIKQEVRIIRKVEDCETENMVLACLIGMGPVDSLLRNPEVSEIMINNPEEIYIEMNGVLQKTDLKYRDNDDVLNVLYRIVQQCGRRINFSNPLVTARLPDGSRVNAIIPPASIHPVITIRKFVQKVFDTQSLIESDFMSQEMATFFQTVVKGKANIVICGATGGGKTTLLRWMAGCIPANERVITIEQTRELSLDHPHCIALEESDKAAIYDLMVNALHMRPDRILLGEVRGAEALELLQAMGTGHDGSLTTVHTNYGKAQGISRLVRAMAKARIVAPEELKAMIAETIDLMVFVKRYSDGSRHIINVSQIIDNDGMPEFEDIFQYSRKHGHQQVGQITSLLRGKIADNLTDDLPNIPSLGGGDIA